MFKPERVIILFTACFSISWADSARYSQPGPEIVCGPEIRVLIIRQPIEWKPIRTLGITTSFATPLPAIRLNASFHGGLIWAESPRQTKWSLLRQALTLSWRLKFKKENLSVEPAIGVSNTMVAPYGGISRDLPLILVNSESEWGATASLGVGLHHKRFRMNLPVGIDYVLSRPYPLATVSMGLNLGGGF